VRRKFRWGWLAVAAIPTLFIGYFFLYPVGRLIVLGLSEFTAGTAAVESRLARVGWFTLWQATVSTVLTFLVAGPLTWAVSTYRFAGRKVATALVTVPFVLPTVVVGTAFVALGWRGTVGAILAAHVFFNVAVVVRTVSTLWARIDPSLHEAARVLGCSPSQVFTRVTLPLLRPALAAAASIVFLFTFTSFGVVLILGGFQYATIEVEIYRQAISLFNLPLAASLAVVQLVGVSLALWAYARYQERTAVSWTTETEADLPRPTGRARVWVAASVVGTLGLLSIPLASLFGRSLGGGYYRRLFESQPVVGRPIEAVGDSMIYALAAMLLATVVGMLAATVITGRRGRMSQWFDTVLMLPLGTSAVIVGFGFIVGFGALVGVLPFDLRTSPLLIPIAHALVALPLVVRSVTPVMRSIDARLREAAAVLGASPARAWREVDLPIVGRALLVGGGFAFAVSLGEFGATLFIARPDSPTMPLAIFRLLSQPGALAFGQAMAMSVVLMVVTATAILLIDRFRSGAAGQF
jgi:thiamine transport system permease protein